ncbi:MAG: hypothetical protein M3Z09_00435, partial [Acidobacteriota bacterium]|nr:hypothetical protein [Acidobacteriota bacterium]
LIVSEETGSMSVAAFGDMEQGLTIEQVDDRISRHFGVGRFKSQRSQEPMALPRETESQVYHE